MKKLLVTLALLTTISPANAATRTIRPIPRTVRVYHTDYNTKQLAIAAVFLATVAVVVGIHASENNQGQVRLVQF